MRDIIHQYALFCEETSWYMHAGERSAPELAYLVLGLVGESGEFADAFKKIIRDEGFRDIENFYKNLDSGKQRETLINELGDVLWYLVRICDFFDLDLRALMVRNTFKLYNRLIEKGRLIPEETPWPFDDPSYEEMVSYAVTRDLPRRTNP